jgi:AcrR family transcriptional regulator
MSQEGKPRVVGRPHKGSDGDAKNRILEAALVSFAEAGIKASSIKGISRKAGCTPALVHYHFQDKDTLVREVLEARVAPVLLRFWETAELGLEPGEMVLELARRVRAASKEAPWFLPIWSRELASEGGFLRSYFRPRLISGLAKRFFDAVLEGQRQGGLNPDLSPALIYVTTVSNACFPAITKSGWERIFGEAVSESDLESHVMSLITKGIACRSERSPHEPINPGAGREAGQGQLGGRSQRRPPSRRRSGGARREARRGSAQRALHGR